MTFVVGKISFAAIIVAFFYSLQPTSAESMMASRAWSWYKDMLMKRPLLTKATTAAIVMSFSDMVCQKVEVAMHKDLVESKGPDVNLQHGCPTHVHATSSHNDKHLIHDWERTAHVAITGFTWSGPVSHSWYNILEAVVKIRHAVLGVLVRMALDAAIFSPVAVAGYFTWRTILEGKGIDGVISKLRAKWQGAVVASWEFWPLANVVNFSVVPVQFRVLYNNCLSLLWNGFLSHVNAKRLEQVVEERIQNPHAFVPRGGGQPSLAEEAANQKPCVCCHCRPVRA
jgi:protein Mpv17